MSIEELIEEANRTEITENDLKELNSRIQALDMEKAPKPLDLNLRYNL
jgi:hypothetical protein